MYNIQVNQAKLDHEELLMYNISTILEERHGLIETKELESSVNYTGDYINRIVKKHTGKTLTTYKRSFTLNEAARLLHESDYNITYICEKLGYHNRTFFNKAFKEMYGVAPIEYRNNKLLSIPQEK